ncbi:MAG: hypothetical protein Q8N53_12090 [Longimicrobiales bacterium]|nr:hypothetical protein [Longimicrobiales bacterium]
MGNVHPLRYAATLLVLSVGLTGCVSGGGQGPSTGVRVDPNHITESELEPLYQMTAFEAVQRLRPRWFQTRTGTFPTVHVDGSIRTGGTEVLQSLRAADVQEMSYMNAADATTRFGTNYFSGLILVTTKR